MKVDVAYSGWQTKRRRSADFKPANDEVTTKSPFSPRFVVKHWSKNIKKEFSFSNFKVFSKLRHIKCWFFEHGISKAFKILDVGVPFLG
ncbi:hypothetical protein Cflav_PD3618 [Pedosphaera parvula Ellin514]|uniref:Uncharacterized protein n=1 Tax=Pedosphaera parvula (strain Ellin514) TaxID=320771 RepID=B9XHC5_PEDPL|nr:hypothetical protein Cflav_PD3618 [Pedosphaera parvula Ellin514]